MTAVAKWENDGDPNADGLYVASVDTGDGRGIQRFEGKSHKDVADKLMDAQLSASQKIGELDSQVKASRRPVIERPLAAPNVELTADEKVKIASDLENPATAADAIKTVTEKVVSGVQAADDQKAERKRKEVDAAVEFRKQQPLYVFSDHNARVMSRYMELNKLDKTVVDNFHIAFDNLLEAKLVQTSQPETPAAAPATAPPNESREPERIAPTPNTRPRGTRASSGLHSEQSSGSPPPPAPKTNLTRADVEQMPSAEYEKRYREEPQFRRIVDDLYKAPAKTGTR